MVNDSFRITKDQKTTHKMNLHGQAVRKGTMLNKPVVLLDLVADTTPPISAGQTSKKGNLLAPYSCTP